MRLTYTNYPTDHQSLFLMAIEQTRAINGEFYDGHDNYILRHWARGYALAHGLRAPVDDQTYGIYYEPDEDELE